MKLKNWRTRKNHDDDENASKQNYDVNAGHTYAYLSISKNQPAIEFYQNTNWCVIIEDTNGKETMPIKFNRTLQKSFLYGKKQHLKFKVIHEHVATNQELNLFDIFPCKNKYNLGEIRNPKSDDDDNEYNEYNVVHSPPYGKDKKNKKDKKDKNKKDKKKNKSKFMSEQWW